jgi:hypothetical protein
MSAISEWSVATLLTLPRSGYRGSDLVLWHTPDDFGTAAIPAAIGGTREALWPVGAMPALGTIRPFLFGRWWLRPGNGRRGLDAAEPQRKDDPRGPSPGCAGSIPP